MVVGFSDTYVGFFYSKILMPVGSRNEKEKTRSFSAFAPNTPVLHRSNTPISYLLACRELLRIVQ